MSHLQRFMESPGGGGLRGWAIQRHPHVPQQANGHDCGMFAVMFARDVCGEFRRSPYARVGAVRFAVHQRQMPELRHYLLQALVDGHEGDWGCLPEDHPVLSDPSDGDSDDLVML